MTDKEEKKLRNQLKALQRLGLPPDKSFLSLISTHTTKKTEKDIAEQNVRV